MDPSNAYEKFALEFIDIRGGSKEGIGVSSVQNWLKGFSKDAEILDLGCGTGLPITKVLIDAKMRVYGIDSSPGLLRQFRKNFPQAPVACEAVEESPFFHRCFDGILAWGLVFLLNEDAQLHLFLKIAESLKPNGRLLFTAPEEECVWKDQLTSQESRSLGSQRYTEALENAGLILVNKFEDEGGNHYFEAVKQIASQS